MWTKGVLLVLTLPYLSSDFIVVSWNFSKMVIFFMEISGEIDREDMIQKRLATDE